MTQIATAQVRIPVNVQHSSRQLARFCALLAHQRKGENIIAIDISAIDGTSADWFVIVTCLSTQQLRGIAEFIENETTRAGVQRPRSEGWEAMQWIVLDYFDVVVHLMHSEARQYYKLEKLWGDGIFYYLSPSGRLLRQHR